MKIPYLIFNLIKKIKHQRLHISQHSKNILFVPCFVALEMIDWLCCYPCAIISDPINFLVTLILVLCHKRKKEEKQHERMKRKKENGNFYLISLFLLLFHISYVWIEYVKKINGVQTVVNYIIYKWELKNKYTTMKSVLNINVYVFFPSCLLFIFLIDHSIACLCFRVAKVQ